MENKKSSADKIKDLKNKISELNKTYKIIILAVVALILFDGLLGASILIVQKASLVKMVNVSDGSKSEFVYLDSNAKSSHIKKQGLASYKFTKHQLETIERFIAEKETAALVLRVEFCPSKKEAEVLNFGRELSLKYGFLSDSDFTSKNKYVPVRRFDNSKITVSANIKKVYGTSSTFDLSFAFPKIGDLDKEIAKGFFVYSDLSCKIKSVFIAPAVLGFDRSEEIPFFGFSANGGVVDSSFSSVDFSNGSVVFPVSNSYKTTMPQIIVKLSSKDELQSTVEETLLSKLNIGGEQIFVKNVRNATEVVIPSGSLKNPFVLIDIAEKKECIEGILMKTPEVTCSNAISGVFEPNSTEVYAPIKTDPGLILKYNPENWRVRDYEVYEWDRFPGILFFDTRNYDIQANFFSRMAYFVEKEGFKGQILTNEQLNGKHGYNAHDYSAESMAAFFNAADAKGVTLNKEEEALRKILLQNGLLVPDGDKVAAGKGGLVSISQESAEYLRTQLLAHEGWHTIFFADEDFRNFVAAVYYTMDSMTRDFLIDYFKSQTSLGYDTNDDYLMNNEFMAYIMQQGVNHVVNYFVTHAKWETVRKYTPELSDYIIKTNASGFEDAAHMLNDFVFDKYGIICGNIALVRR